MNQEEELMMEQAQASIDAQRAQTGNLTGQSLLQAQASEEQDKGLAEEQLDLSAELERIDNLLRGNIIKRDEQGTEYWDEPKKKVLCKCIEDQNGFKYWTKTSTQIEDEYAPVRKNKEIVFKLIIKDKEIEIEDEEGFELMKQINDMQDLKIVGYDLLEIKDTDMSPLNDHGVRVLMKTITIYLSKRKLLSNYDEDTVNEKMEDFSIELADLIFMQYREMGLNTTTKKKMYSMIIREIQDSVHDIYLRALGGKERDSIRKHWNIQENMGQNGGQQMAGRGNRMNPLAWGRR